MDLSQQTKPYPRYLYHRDFNEPKIVNSKVEEVELGTKGWSTARLFKEYPKWVGDTIVQSEADERRLLSPNKKPEQEVPSPDVMFDEGLSATEDPLAVKETQVDSQDTATIEKPKKPGRPKKT